MVLIVIVFCQEKIDKRVFAISSDASVTEWSKQSETVCNRKETKNSLYGTIRHFLKQKRLKP
jgi:hypothetical protein